SVYRWKDLPQRHKVLLQFLAVMTYFMGNVEPGIPANMRFLVFTIPLFLYFIIDSAAGIKTARKLLPAAGVLAALISMYGAQGYRTYFLNACDDATTTKMQAGAWIDANLPGASVAHTADLIPFTFPPLRLAERRIVVYEDVPTLLRDKDKPDYLVATGTLLYTATPQERKAFFDAYELVKEFANSTEVMPDSWRMMAANITVYVYKKV
ncbi:MAG: hypothetical protein Q8O90_11965, partial [Elusimicrobiota bacterium]|nr:hypothetical protein [Elusimicrobiota bacterium]